MYSQSTPSRFLPSSEPGGESEPGRKKIKIVKEKLDKIVDKNPKENHGIFDFEGSRVELREELKAKGPKEVAKPSEGAKPFFIFYYWSRCPHCHEFAPEFKKMSKDDEDDEEDYYAIESNDIPGELGIHSFPTVILYDEDGKEQERVVGCHKKEQEEKLFSDTLKRLERLEDMVKESKNMVKKHVVSDIDYIKIMHTMIMEITPKNVNWIYGSKYIPNGTFICVFHDTCYISPLKVIDCPHGPPTCKNFDDLVYCEDVNGTSYTYSCKNGDKFYHIG